MPYLTNNVSGMRHRKIYIGPMIGLGLGRFLKLGESECENTCSQQTMTDGADTVAAGWRGLGALVRFRQAERVVRAKVGLCG